MATGYRNVYRYYCSSEPVNKNWVTEERAEMDIPISCINNPTHIIKESSISVVGRFTRLNKIVQNELFDECNLEKIDLINIVEKCTLLSQRVKVLESILEKMNQIKFV